MDIGIAGYRALYSKSIPGRGVATLTSWFGTDIEITGKRVLYNKSIASRGVARFLSWLGAVGQFTASTEYLTVILEYIDLFGSVQPTFG